MTAAVKEAIALRNRLGDRWRSPAYAEAWRRDMAKHNASHAFSMPLADMARAQTVTLHDSPAYYVADGALDVLAAAAPSFQPEPLLATDLTTPAGFMVCARPLFAYGAEDAEDIIYAPHNWRQIPTRGPLAFAWWPIYARTPNAEDVKQRNWCFAEDADAPRDGIHVASYLHSNGGDWILAEAITVPFGEDYWLANEHTNVWTLMKPFQALARLMRQEVLATTRETAGGKKSRRAAKNEPVLVVWLPRHQARHTDGDGHVAWSRQWWVAGHWRNQWYPSIEAHRQKWINGYVKGPDDKPFVPREGRAFTLVGDTRP